MSKNIQMTALPVNPLKRDARLSKPRATIISFRNPYIIGIYLPPTTFTNSPYSHSSQWISKFRATENSICEISRVEIQSVYKLQ